MPLAMRTVVYSPMAADELDALPEKAREQVVEAVNRYAMSGVGDVKRLAGREGLRLRSGRYRVLFDEDGSNVLVVRIVKRQTTTSGDRAMGAQFIKTPGGEELAVLPRAEYERLVETLAAAEDDLADVAAYDAAKADPRGTEALPAGVSRHVSKGASLVKAIRMWRAISQSELAAKAGVSQGFLSDLENRRRARSPEIGRKLAKALNVPEHWLI